MAELTFESVNAEIEALDLDQLENNMQVEAKDDMARAKAIPNVCVIWNSIGVIIKLIAKIPFLPSKWRRALKLLITTMDGICG